MLQRIKSRITSAHLIATIALFAALGGGYATAFKGSGTLQKAAVDGMAPNVFEDIRTLKNFGVLQALCDTGDGDVDYRLKNSSSKPIVIEWFDEDDGTRSMTETPAGATSAEIESGDLSNTLRFHLWKPVSGVKAQVDMTVTNNGPGGFTCQQTRVRILALNTQE